MTEQLAIEGGPRAVTEPLPTFQNAAGRTFGAEEEALVLEALGSGCLSRNGGTLVKRLESEFAARLGVRHVVACSSGSASVHLAIAALDLDPGDEVIVPPITDIGSIAPVLWQNAIPVFADIDPATFCMNPAEAARWISPRTRAIMAVHLAGQPCQLGALRRLCDERKLVLIEDCSQAYWAESGGRLVGTHGDLACFSLQQSKHMTCGEGGLMATSNDAWARRAMLFADKAWPRDTNSLGSSRFLFLAQNYRMSELQGAVALAQLGKVAAAVERRREAARRFGALIADIPQVAAPVPAPDTNPAYWLYMLRVPGGSRRFGDALVAEGVPAWVQYMIDPLYLSPLFTEGATYGRSGYPLHEYARQEYRRGLCPNAERSLQEVIAIWWNENYSERNLCEMAAAVRKVACRLAS